MAYVVFADGYGITCRTADGAFAAHRNFLLASAADGDMFPTKKTECNQPDGTTHSPAITLARSLVMGYTASLLTWPHGTTRTNKKIR